MTIKILTVDLVARQLQLARQATQVLLFGLSTIASAALLGALLH